MQTLSPRAVTGITITIIMIFMLNPDESRAQLGNFNALIQGGVDDAETLATEYLRPFGSGFGANLNTGWNNTAPVHGVLGFSATVKTGLALVPEKDHYFDIEDLNLNNMQVMDPFVDPGTLSPTLSGADEPGPEMEAFVEYEFEGEERKQVISNFEMPAGVGHRVVRTPIIQGNLGLIRDTEVSLRYMPPLFEYEDFDYQVFGGGIKHELNQYIPAGGLWPVTIALQGGFTRILASFDDFSLTPDDFRNVEPENDFDASEWEDQKLSMTTDAWNVNLLVGRNFPLISVFGGVGIEGSNIQVLTEGNYPVVEPAPTADDPERITVESVEEPVDISIDGRNRFRGLLGARLRLGFIYVTAEYTYADYHVINGGIGVGLR